MAAWALSQGWVLSFLLAHRCDSLSTCAGPPPSVARDPTVSRDSASPQSAVWLRHTSSEQDAMLRRLRRREGVHVLGRSVTLLYGLSERPLTQSLCSFAC